MTEHVKALVTANGRTLFRAACWCLTAAKSDGGEDDCKNMAQKARKSRMVGAYFAVSDAKSELSLWDSRLQVTSRGYMLGYTDLKDPSVSGFFRFLARVGDGMMKMQIVKIRFGGKQ